MENISGRGHVMALQTCLADKISQFSKSHNANRTGPRRRKNFERTYLKVRHTRFTGRDECGRGLQTHEQRDTANDKGIASYRLSAVFKRTALS